MAPAVGQLTDRVQLQRKSTTAEPEGGHLTVFVPVNSLWARVRTLSAAARAFGDGRGTEITHSVVVRHRTDVSPGDRFVYRGRALEVRGTEDIDGRRVWLGCRCTETGLVG
jgi:SPP1 family predicted phage head-tail adaptor